MARFAILTGPYSGNFEKLWNRYKVCPQKQLYQAILKTECRKLMPRHLITAASSLARESYGTSQIFLIFLGFSFQISIQ